MAPVPFCVTPPFIEHSPTAHKGTDTMDRETYKQEVQKAADEDDLSRMRELERLELQGRVGEDDNPPSTAEEAYRREVDRARRTGDHERMKELEQMEAEGEIEKAMRTSDRVQTRLSAAINEAEEEGNTDFVNQLHSIRDAPDTAAALQSAMKAATGERYERLQEIQEGL